MTWQHLGFGLAVASGMTSSQRNEIIVWLLMATCGVVAYRLALRARRLLGVSPWRVPPIVWGLLGAVFLVFGLLLETIARLTTRPVPPASRGGDEHDVLARDGWNMPTSAGLAADGPGGDGNGFSTGSVRRGGDEISADLQPKAGFPAPEGWSPSSALVPDGGPPPLFGWYPDPSGRHEQRYWDGRHWADRVADDGVRADDVLGEP